MTAQEEKKHSSFEEYLELEKSSEERLEYYFGEVFAMAGSTKRHNRIVGNIRRLLENLIDPTNCDVFSENVKLELLKNARYVYPDVMMTCSTEDLKDDTETIIRHPSIVIEVLSERTADYDTGGKKRAYFQLPSLHYYVIIWQKTCAIEVYERESDFWKLRTYVKPEEMVVFPKFDFKIPVKEVYRQVTFDVSEDKFSPDKEQKAT